jgi:hypothetical protein
LASLAATTLRGNETVVFAYAPEWLADPDRFSSEPALALTRGSFAPPAGQAIFGSIGDSAPDTWGAASCSVPSGDSPSAKAVRYEPSPRASTHHNTLTDNMNFFHSCSKSER